MLESPAAVLKKIGECGIVPVIKLDSPDSALPLARALCEGGIPVAEVTFRTEAAEESIRIIARDAPDILVGAGTVLTADQADRALAAGAKFIVTPGFNPKVVRHCVERDVPITPGVSSPSQVEQGLEESLTVMKLFPAEQVGGTGMLKALAGPYGGVKFIPTGGVGMGNLREYLSLPNVLAVGGSWMAPPALINEGNFAAVAGLCREAVAHMLNLGFAHLGINGADSAAAGGDAAYMASLFGFPVREGSGSFFSGPSLEFLKKPAYGHHGHIAIGTDSVERALAYFARAGVGTRHGTEGYLPDGSLRNVYLDVDVAGFAVHLIKN